MESIARQFALAPAVNAVIPPSVPDGLSGPAKESHRPPSNAVPPVVAPAPPPVLEDELAPELLPGPPEEVAPELVLLVAPPVELPALVAEAADVEAAAALVEVPPPPPDEHAACRINAKTTAETLARMRSPLSLLQGVRLSPSGVRLQSAPPSVATSAPREHSLLDELPGNCGKENDGGHR